VNDVSAQNHRMREGERNDAAIERHVTAWIKANRKAYDGWLTEARAASRQ
jgi:glycine betaine/proline transport system substrate-binding protein